MELIYRTLNRGDAVIEDEKIIDLYWARSEDAISETDKKYRKQCMYVANNILNNISDCEECLNDTYMTAWNKMPPERPGFLAAFLCKIIRNHSIKKYDYFHRSKRNKQAEISIEELGECITASDITEEKYYEKETVRALNEFLGLLSKEKRVIFIRRYWFYDSYSQIAEQCGGSEDSIKMSLSRMRQKLREFLEERGLS